MEHTLLVWGRATRNLPCMIDTTALCFTAERDMRMEFRCDWAVTERGESDKVEWRRETAVYSQEEKNSILSEGIERYVCIFYKNSPGDCHFWQPKRCGELPWLSLVKTDPGGWALTFSFIAPAGPSFFRSMVSRIIPKLRCQRTLGTKRHFRSETAKTNRLNDAQRGMLNSFLLLLPVWTCLSTDCRLEGTNVATLWPGCERLHQTANGFATDDTKTIKPPIHKMPNAEQQYCPNFTCLPF